MLISDLVRKLVKLTDDDKLDWQPRPGGFCSSNKNNSITIIRQVNKLGIVERTDLIFVSGDDLTKTPSSFNLCDYDYTCLVDAIGRVETRRRNAIEIGQLKHAESVIAGIVGGMLGP